LFASPAVVSKSPAVGSQAGFEADIFRRPASVFLAQARLLKKNKRKKTGSVSVNTSSHTS
jgi:hypothetical protein